MEEVGCVINSVAKIFAPELLQKLPVKVGSSDCVAQDKVAAERDTDML